MNAAGQATYNYDNRDYDITRSRDVDYDITRSRKRSHNRSIESPQRSTYDYGYAPHSKHREREGRERSRESRRDRHKVSQQPMSAIHVPGAQGGESSKDRHLRHDKLVLKMLRIMEKVKILERMQ